MSYSPLMHDDQNDQNIVEGIAHLQDFPRLMLELLESPGEWPLLPAGHLPAPESLQSLPGRTW